MQLLGPMSGRVYFVQTEQLLHPWPEERDCAPKDFSTTVSLRVSYASPGGNQWIVVVNHAE